MAPKELPSGPKSVIPYSEKKEIQTQQKGIEDIRQKYSKAKSSKILCMFDATGSMSSVWIQTMSILTDLTNRLTILGKFSLRWIAYRDYVDGSEVINSSDWTADALQMQKFIRSIECFGGGGNKGEAVEEALKLASDDLELTLGILIGDEPPLDSSACNRYAIKFRERGIPVNTFAVRYGYDYDNRTINAFESIAEKSGGVFNKLEKVEDLIHVITMSAAFDMGGKAKVEQYLDEMKKKGLLTDGAESLGRKLLNK